MCNFASFLISEDGRIKAYDMFSHADTAKHHGLSPDSYRECEWLCDDPCFLFVRSLETDSIVFRRARDIILSNFPDRKSFLEACFGATEQMASLRTAIKSYDVSLVGKAISVYCPINERVLFSIDDPSKEMLALLKP